MKLARRLKSLALPPVLLFWFLAAGIGSTGILTYQSLSDQAREAEKQKALGIANLKVKAVLEWQRQELNRAVVGAADLSAARHLRSFLSPHPPPLARDRLLEWFDGLIRFSRCSELVLLNADGIPILSDGSGEPDTLVQDAPALRAMIERGVPVMTDFQYADSSSSLHLHLVVPLPVGYDTGAAKLGALLMRVDPEESLFSAILGSEIDNSLLETVIVRREGDQVVFLSPVAGGNSIRGSVLRMPVADSRHIAAMAARGAEGLLEGVNNRGEPVLAAARTVPGTAWHVIVKIREDAFLKPVHERGMYLTALCILLIVAAGLVIAGWSHRQRLDSFRAAYENEVQQKVILRHYEYLTKFAHDIILVADAQGKLIEANERACAIYGFDRERLDRIYLRELESENGPADDGHSEAEGITYETVHRRSDGILFPVEVSRRTIAIDGREYRQYIIRDISERKREEENTRKAYEALRESEESFSMLFREMSNGFALHEIICDERGKPVDYRFLKINPAFEHITGITASKAVGRCVREVLPGLDKKWIEKYGHVALTGEDLYFEDFEPITGWHYAIHAFSPVRGTFAVIFDNITERRVMEQELRESEERFRTLATNAPVGIFFANMNGDCIYVNDQWCEIAGISDQQANGQGWIDAIFQPDRETVLREWELSVREGLRFALEYRFQAPDGRITWVSASALPLKNAEGIVTGYLGAITDITEIKNAEEERLHLRAQLLESQKMESIATLAGGIAHDFNNILHILIGYFQMLQAENALPEKRLRYHESIQRALDRGAALVQQILTFARRKESLIAPFDLLPTTKELIKMLEETFPKTIRFVSELPAELPLIPGDAGQIYQALLNICVNARDAMPMGGSITFRASVVSGDVVRANHPAMEEVRYVLLTITDSGLGMDEQTQKRIFEPFYTTKELGKGTGLGLAVVYGVMQTHRGCVDVSSVYGHGSTFSLYFPVVYPAGQDPVAENGNMDAFPRGTETILLVEDEEDLMEYLRTLLTEKGYEVVCAKNGQEGFERFQLHHASIQAIISDLDLPILRGNDMVRLLKGEFPDIPIVMISGYYDMGTREELESMYRLRLLEKPVPPSVLLKEVRAALDEAVRHDSVGLHDGSG